MLFNTSYLELWQPLCSVEWNHFSNLLERTHEKQFCDEFGPVVQEEMPFKDSFYLELWQPFCLSEWTHLCNFGRGHYE